MSKAHHYHSTTTWTGNTGEGTISYKAYERSHVISIAEKPDFFGSSDPAFRGDKTKHNPEDLLLAATSACHMLWYLHFCSVNGVVVTHYVDRATGTMVEHADGSGEFTEIVLHPKITVKDASMVEKAHQLHHDAHQYCFIARSVNFTIKHQPTVLVESQKIL